MAKRARKRSRGKGRRRARRNPMGGGLRLALGAGALVLAGYGGYRGYRYFKAHRGTGRPGLEGGGAPPGPITCEIGPSYPGFVQAEDGTCSPSGTTPPGIYVDVACSDFVFVPGDDGPQPDLLEKLIAAARAQAMVPQAPSADPILITSAYLHAFWPACEWPPGTDGPARLVHMYEAICFIVGRTIVEQGGRVLGTRNASIVDDLIADRLSKMGLPDFDQEIVPELPIEGPDRWLGPAPVPPTTGGDVTGTGAPATEIERLKNKLCSHPEDLNAFERITLINEVISPILDTRVANLGNDPTLQQLDNMFQSIGRRVLQGCPVTQRKPGIAVAKKMAHDLWIQRYNQGQQLDTDVPPPPPFEPIPPGPGGVSGGELPVCAVEPYRRTKSVDLPQLSWGTRKVYETKIFEFSGPYEACQDYDLLVGVCLRVPADNPYGLLSQFFADPTMDFGLSKLRIQNIHQEPMDWDSFRSPPAYKQQIRARIRMVTLPNGQRYADTGVARDDVTGSQAGNAVDPCPALVDHWPRPAAGAYNVVAWDDAWYNWEAMPTVEIVDKNMAVYLRVTYTGVPAFNWKPEHDDARVVFSLTDPVLQIKSVATGNTP